MTEKIHRVLDSVYLACSWISGISMRICGDALWGLMPMFLHRDYKWSGLPKLVHRTERTVCIVMILIGFAASFGYLMTLTQIPLKITAAMTALSDSRHVILALINGMLLALGTLMATAALVPILTSILLSVVKAIGIDPAHFSMITMVNLGIGLITPPVGAVLFVGSAVTKLRIEEVVKAMWPFFAILFAALSLVTYVPAISLWLRRRATQLVMNARLYAARASPRALPTPACT